MDALSEHTRQALARHTGAPLMVGYSGGGDSSSLLHVLAALPEVRAQGLRAIHINHGLHPQAAQWAEHCRAFCESLEVPLQVVTVTVDQRAGDGPEGAARKARYAAFTDHLRAGEALLLAHHRDDQAETILLKLLRGAGPQGLAGMRAWRPFASGWLWRPWLDCRRDLLCNYQIEHALEVIEDPANTNANMARSWLREQLMPRLERHWPQAVASITHSGSLSAAASDFIDNQVAAEQDLISQRDGSLDATRWLDLHDALRAPLLDRWLHERRFTAPSTVQRLELERQTRQADGDGVPHLHWPGVDVRLWRGRLHASAPLPDPQPDWHSAWDGTPLALPLGALHLEPPDTSESNALAPSSLRLPHSLTVRLRRGGEYLHPAGDSCGRELRYIFQQAGLPPWLRPWCPLVYNGEELLAVADLCLTAAGQSLFDALGVLPQWRYHGRQQSLRDR